MVACSGSGGASPSALPSPLESAPAAATGSQVVNVTVTDALRIEPAEIVVHTGEVDFVVTNSGAIEHEFFVGDEAAQAQHEQEMAKGGMPMDEPAGISVPPGATKTLRMIFPSVGATLAGCHVSGHYAGGMRAAITIGG